MKHFFFTLFFTFHFFALFAQETLEIDTTAPAGYVTMEYAFEQFNTSQVSTGLLLDRSFPFSKLAQYNGTLSDTNRVSAMTFGLAYAHLSGSALNIAAQLPDPSLRLGTYSSADDTIPIKMLYFQYHQIKASALADGDIGIQNNQLVNIPGRNPFELDTAFLATPWANATLKGDTFSFLVQAPITNDSAAIQSIMMDFGDGQGWRTVTIGQVLHIGYAQSDTVTVRYRLSLSGGIWFESHSRIIINIPPENREYGLVFDIPGIEGATVTGLSTCGDESLCKPLIVVEGFNAPAFGDEFDTNFGGFRSGVSIVGTPTGNTLYSEFESAGYDLVYINFTDGTASLESNAEVVKAVIRKVNELKAETGCTEKNVVLGQSMGGVLAKLALREMEEAEENHQCYKLFTHDSPLRGANIPLGYQHMVSHIANISAGNSFLLKQYVAELEDAEKTLNAPAPSQMLIYHHQSFPSYNTPFRQFYEKLRNLGALEHCEHIAICNGSQVGSGQGFGANARLLKIQGNGADILDDCANFSEFWADYVANFAKIFLGTELEFNFEVHALPSPAQGEKEIYRGYVKAKILFIPIVYGNRTVKVGGTQPLDNASGGYVEIPTDDIPSCLSEIVQIDQTNFCFIPSVSAIEVGPFVGAGVPLSNVNADISNNASVLASGLSTLDRYVAYDDVIPPGAPSSALNQYHISYSNDNTGAMLYELIDITSPTGFLNNRTFNYGSAAATAYNYSSPGAIFKPKQTSKFIEGNLTIEQTGKIWVNRNNRIAFTDDANNPLIANPSTFDVYLTDRPCTPASPTVTVKNGGEITVGEWSASTNNIGRLHVGKDATLNIDRNGTVDVGDYATLFSENEGVTNVLSGGFLHVNWWEGKIVVRNGGVLRVHGGGTLRVSNGASVVVEDGGRLIIEPQAKIQLWGGVVQGNAESRIHIKRGGELIINGEFDFSHDGYFRFDNGYLLTLGNGVFKLKGAGKNTRFIQLNYTDLVVTGTQLLDFKDGAIQYIGATITAQEGGRINFKNMTCSGGGKALYLDNPNLVSLNQIDIIEGFSPAIEAWNVRNNIPFNVSNCNIEVGTTKGVEGYDCQLLRFTNTNFIEPHPTDKTIGFELINVQMLSLSNCNISNMEIGIHAIDSKVVLMRGGEIANCDFGIKDDLSLGLVGTPVNLMMFDGATIRNSQDKAVYILGSKSSGSVLMDCAKLIDNANGIVGEEITLMIDAEENRQCVTDPVAPNIFKKQANQGPFFSICYRLKDIGQVEAKANYWFPHTQGNWTPMPGSWDIRRMLSSNGPPCSDFVGFNSSMAVQNEPIACTFPTIPCQGGEIPAPLADCEIEFENEPIVVHEEFHSGINAIKNEQMEIGEALLAPVSSLKGNLGTSLAGVCKNFVEMAYAIVETNVGRPSVRRREASFGSQSDDEVSIAPNPSADFVRVKCLGHFDIAVIDGLGRIVWEQSAEDLATIHTNRWPTGIYTIKIQSQTQRKQVQKTLVVQR